MDPWITLIAVAGTLAGASITPIVKAINSSRRRRSDALNKRAAAAVRFAVALLDYAFYSPAAYTLSDVKKYRRAALQARVELISHLGKGDSGIDYFTEYAITHIAEYREPDERVMLANHAARRVNEWARGEISADLRPFVLTGQDRALRETRWDTENRGKGYVPPDA